MKEKAYKDLCKILENLEKEVDPNDVNISKNPTPGTTRIGQKVNTPDQHKILQEPIECHEIEHLDHFANSNDLLNFIKLMCVPTNIKQLDKAGYIKAVKQFKEIYDMLTCNIDFLVAAAENHRVLLNKKMLTGLNENEIVKMKISKIYNSKTK
jgi:hypothetical protein